MTVTATATVYCVRCGRTARDAQPSMDAAHPIVVCYHENAAGHNIGCGRSLGTFSKDEAEAAADRLHVARVEAQHSNHVRLGRPSSECRHCRAAPPERKPRAHLYRMTAGRLSTAAHLEMLHADDRYHATTATATAQELDDYHRSLHQTGERR